ncbi:hypothetical protein [Maribellus maritimus]|uniref:hypothetical protein n=1 Tax=Maribellus maritimus TaxID=2870838 RepID=UPI001EEA0BB7|nr:hypothetical protein [Maribellus maritimus]MCG6187870.1 hypothetical protein [Maribellus maritimus]
MIINNKLDHILSGPKAFAATLFVITGIFIVFMGHIILGLSIAIFVLFLLTSYSGVEIDTVNHRIKQYNKFFGIVKTGQWKNMNSFIGLTLVPMRRVNTIASRANITNTTVKRDYRIYLVNKAKKPAFAIKICKTRHEAQNSIDEFSIWLKLPVYSAKK